MRKPAIAKRSPGAVRDAILQTLQARPDGKTVATIAEEVERRLGPTPASSIRSYLRLNTPQVFRRMDRGRYALAESARVREEEQTRLPMLDEINGHCRAGKFATIRIRASRRDYSPNNDDARR